MTRRPRPGLFPTIHPIESVASQPVSMMMHWRLFQIRGPLGRRSRHLVGRCNGEGRVCSALYSIDLTSLTALSGSGRFYRLQGPPRQDPDASYVWEEWTRFNRATHVKDVTRALIRLRRMRGLQDMKGMSQGVPPAEP